MKTEIEAKFLDIDPADIRAKLKELGASLIHPETNTRQKIFDYPDFMLDKASSWLRLREENGAVTLTFKKWEHEGLHGMKEIETRTDSFDGTEKLLLGIGMKVKSDQRKRRELWRLGETEFMIDTWPWLPTFLEVEGSSEEGVRNAAARLGLDWRDALFGGAAGIYKHYFDVEYEEIDRCPEIMFSPVPDWLEKKRIHRP
jgi:adenylate cyclase class 2